SNFACQARRLWVYSPPQRHHCAAVRGRLPMRVARFLLALAVLAPAVAGLAVVSETRAAAGEAQPQVPWRNSMIVYERATTVRSAVPDWDLTYNPISVHTLSLRREWHFSEWFFTRFRFDLEQELTTSDYTTKKNEILWS